MFCWFICRMQICDVGTVGCRKTGNEHFPNVNLILSICQLIVYATILIIFKNIIEFRPNLVRRFHTMKRLYKCANFILMVPVFFATNLNSNSNKIVAA
jgi:hypothetical protein